jgi:cytochrome c peroxidase
LSNTESTGLRHFALVPNNAICHHGPELLGSEIQDQSLEPLFLSGKDTIMKLRIKLERQKIARGHGSSRAQVVQADQRTQRERDRGARKRAILRRELDER